MTEQVGELFLTMGNYSLSCFAITAFDTDESILGQIFAALERMGEAGFKIPSIETNVKCPAFM